MDSRYSVTLLVMESFKLIVNCSTLKSNYRRMWIRKYFLSYFGLIRQYTLKWSCQAFCESLWIHSVITFLCTLNLKWGECPFIFPLLNFRKVLNIMPKIINDKLITLESGFLLRLKKPIWILKSKLKFHKSQLSRNQSSFGHYISYSLNWISAW